MEITLILSTSLFLVFSILAIRYKDRALAAEVRVKWYEKTYLLKNGWSAGFGKYYIASFDQGMHWYNVIDSFTGIPASGLVILGKADDELVKHLLGLERLTQYVKKNGPLMADPSDKTKVDREAKILEDAGFKVVVIKDHRSNVDEAAS